ncbi:MAG: tetratricopeptide repeat protein [Nitrospinota bacterium]
MSIDLEKRNIKFLTCVFLAVSTFGVYSQIQGHEFINFDDPIFITENSNLKKGLTRESIIWAFTNTSDQNWIPLTWISHFLDYQIFGLNPGGHHLTNLLLHIANVLILFLVLFRITGGIWQSGFVAALFALHPLNVESIAWVAERKNVLSTFFCLLTLGAYSYYVCKPEVKRYLLVVLCFILGLMSKPMLVTLPFVLLLLDYWPLGRLKNENKNDSPALAENPVSFYSLIFEKLPLFFISIGGSIATYIIQKSGGAVNSSELLPLQERFVNALVSYIKYLEMMVWPQKLAILYPHSYPALSLWKGLACAVILVCITIAVIKKVEQKPYFAIGWFWYLGTLVPVIGIVQVGVQAMADRYAYVPLIGIFIMVAWGIPELLAKLRQKRKILIILTGLYIPILMVVTWNQVGHWKSSITIFGHTIKVLDTKHPDFSKVHNLLGNALRDKGLNEEAITQYKKAINLNPNYSGAYNNLGNALLDQGGIEEAISHFKKAIELSTDFYLLHRNLGIALLDKGLTEEAILSFKKVIKFNPDFVSAYDDLGLILFSKGKVGEAIPYFIKAIKLKPDFANAYDHLGSALFALGKFEEADLHYRMAIQLKPGLAQAHNNLGNSLYRQKKIEEAISHFKKAIKLKPDYDQAEKNLRKALNSLKEQS